MFPGHATSEGTARYRERFQELSEAGHFRRVAHVARVAELWISSIGLGTYLGETNADASHAYIEAIAEAVRSGINVIDSAINYRHQISERNIGSALKRAIGSGLVQRDEVLICTKAGFLTFDGEPPPNPQAYFIDEYINKGIMRPGEVAGGMHCMAPKYLEDQLERSRQNLAVETIDVFYVHNPESQLSAGVDRAEFRKRLQAAFASLENEVQAGKIRNYGCATWNGFRVAPEQRDYLSLEEVVTLARKVGGESHHFRFVQLPFNLAMPEAFAARNQSWEGETLSLFEAARRAGVAVVGSASLYQARLTANLPEKVLKDLNAKSDLEAAIQFARSAPGITTSLIGMGKREHVQANLEIARKPLVDQKEWEKLFQQVS